MNEAGHATIVLRARDGSLRGGAHVDAEDLGLLSTYHWHLLASGYAFGSPRSGTGDRIYMHRLLMGLERGDGLEVDHINGDRLNNRRANLRVVTRQQNAANMRAHSDSTSSFRGVFWDRGKECWVAQCAVGGTKRHLGCFADELDAARAVDRYLAKVAA